MPTVAQSEAALAELRAAQARADSAYISHGRQAPMPVHGEPVADYRRRLVAPMQRFSADFAKVNLAATPTDILALVETRVYADAVSAARSPRDVAPGTLREICTADASGRKVSEFFGHPDVAFSPFKVPAQRVRIFDPRQHRGSSHHG